MATNKVTTNVIDMSGNTGGLVWAKGTKAQRPTGVAGDLRLNTTDSRLEYKDNADWKRFSEGAASPTPDFQADFLVVGGGGGFDGGSQQQSSTLGGKKYTLTKKLVQDFQLAVKFRMENIETNDALSVGGGMESTIVARTRDIARKIEAYGLPGMPPPNGMTSPPTQPYQEESSCGVGSEDVVNGTVRYRDDYGVDYDDDRGGDDDMTV